MLLLAPVAVWNTLVSYSMRSDRNGVTVNPWTHSSKLSAHADPAGSASNVRRTSRTAAWRPRLRRVLVTACCPVSTSTVMPHDHVLRRKPPLLTLDAVASRAGGV